MPTTEQLTADTITTAQISALKTEAEAAGDTYQADICGIALAYTETANEIGADLVGPDGEIWTRTEARENCAEAINAARAMEDGK